ncbi:MAG: PQQ-like beta-propeller repeat protein, partial [Anaerolineaceae bacterium]|nr:PQQ-like beta-propeller repeat protein [Anaerolineaceae bacterium]
LPIYAPIGSPAIGPDGVIFANTSTGGLAAVSPEGKALWQFVGDDAQPLASPVVGMDGTIYYSTEKHLFAVSAQGEMVWKTLPPTYSFSNPQPRLSPDGKYLFFENSILNAHTGGVIVQDTPGAIDRFLIGTDGRYYLNTRNALNRLTFTPEGLTMETAMKWNQTALNLSFRYAVEGGITPHGRVWLLFSSTFDYFRLIWLDFEDTIYTPLDYPYQYSGYLVGIDRNDISYVCGSNRSTNGSQASCRANHVGDTAPIWKIELEKGGFMVGGAVIPGRIYISTGEGTLYSIGDPPR